MWERCIVQERPSCQDWRSFFNGQRERGIPVFLIGFWIPRIQSAVVEVIDTVAERSDAAVMGDDDESVALLCDCRENDAAGFFIQCACWLICQKQGRREKKGAGNRDALLLPHGKMRYFFLRNSF